MKILIAGGCSFTFEEWNWPSYVSDHYGWILNNTGIGSSDNGLISRRIIYNVETALKGFNRDDIIVGIMWSGINRHSIYKNNARFVGNIDGWSENPTHVFPGEKNWIILNSHWKIPEATNWYRYVHDEKGAIVQTLENILRVQWYLKSRGVRYFMTTFTDIFCTDLGNETSLCSLEIKQQNRFIIESCKEIMFLLDMVDFSKFLPVPGCYEWVYENYRDNGGFNSPDSSGYVGIHPTSKGHESFSKEIIIPFINELYFS